MVGNSGYVRERMAILHLYRPCAIVCGGGDGQISYDDEKASTARLINVAVDVEIASDGFSPDVKNKCTTSQGEKDRSIYYIPREWRVDSGV